MNDKPSIFLQRFYQHVWNSIHHYDHNPWFLPDQRLCANLESYMNYYTQNYKGMWPTKGDPCGEQMKLFKEQYDDSIFPFEEFTKDLDPYKNIHRLAHLEDYKFYDSEEEKEMGLKWNLKSYLLNCIQKFHRKISHH